jgi:hypothetical protein
MTRFPFAAAALSLLAPTAAFAQAGDESATVTRAQLEQMNKERFAEMDANKDGFVTSEELGGERAALMIGRLDSDKDGKVTLPELNARMLASFDFADADKDGTLTPAERAAARDAARARMQSQTQVQPSPPK